MGKLSRRRGERGGGVSRGDAGNAEVESLAETQGTRRWSLSRRRGERGGGVSRGDAGSAGQVATFRECLKQLVLSTPY